MVHMYSHLNQQQPITYRITVKVSVDLLHKKVSRVNVLRTL